MNSLTLRLPKQLLSSLLLLAFIVASTTVVAQFPYNETFKNTGTPGLVLGGAAKLTAAAGIDPAGQGFLRLNENTTYSIGYVYGQDSFPSNYGLTVSFDFCSWKTGATSTNQADGMTFFLFDAAVNAFRPGGTGGSLGYAQYYQTPGLAKGYIGISIDAFGNFSSASDGGKNGGPGQQRGSVAIRGPGNGKAITDYVYQTGVIASDPAYNVGFAAFTQRYADPLNSNYRRIKIIMTPGSSLGATIGYKVTVIMYKGGATLTPVTLINNFDYPFAAPAKLQFGLAASTGSITNYHEVRNMTIDVTNNGSLLAASAANDVGAAVCQGQQALIDVTANDVSANTGGAINKLTIDLDPLTSGKQSIYADPLKGSYAADSNGIVTFTPVPGFTGSSTINYTVADNYGMVSNPASVTVTASTNTGPNLTISNPPAVCFPALVDITNAAWKTSTSPGASYSYFTNLADANNATNNINLLANLITVPGNYYVRASLNGCATVKPITVDINLVPTTANAGTDQSFCSSTGAQTSTLLSVNPDIGIGTWLQLSGPSGVTITYPAAATSPITFTQQGVYTFRWIVASGACPLSIDDVDVSVGNTTANAGPDQSLAGVSSVTLAGNVAGVGAGKWTLASSPLGSTVTINQPNNAASTVQVNRTGDYTFRWTMTNGSCSNNDLVVARIMSLLPVQLTRFTAVLNDEQALLEWTTAGEDNNKAFEIERSTDGQHFSFVYTMAGNGNTGITHQYTYTDNITNLSSPSVYYRLRQVDTDGRAVYSNPVKLLLPLVANMRCWPNPVNNILYIQPPTSAGNSFDINLYNEAGILLKQWHHVSRTVAANGFDITALKTSGVIIVECSGGSKSWRQQMVRVAL